MAQRPAPVLDVPVVRRRHHHRPRWWSGPFRLIAGFVIVGSLLVFAVLALTGRPLPAPEFVVREIEGRANRALAGQVQLRLGGAEAIVDERFIPRIRLTNVEVLSPSGARLALIPDLRATLDPMPLLHGKIAPKTLRLGGAQFDVRRDRAGRLDLPRPASTGEGRVPQAPLELLDALDRAFEVPLLAGIARIEVSDVAIRFDDTRTGQRWNLEDGTLTLDQTDESVAISLGLGLGLSSPGLDPARAEIDFISRKGSPEARMEARISNVSARDLAAQSPALAWLSALDAPISGSLRTGVGADGAVGKMAAVLTIGAGALNPMAGPDPVAFDAARVSLDYDPATGGLRFDEIAFDSHELRLRAGAKAWVQGPEGGLPDAFVAQIAINDLNADPEGLFADPVNFSQGSADLKVELDPFRVQVGHLVLIEEGRRISAEGNLEALANGWAVALDIGIDRIDSERLLALWPVNVVPKTRAWLRDNVATAELSDLEVALRLKPDSEPRLSLGYDFDAAEVRFIRTLPPILEGKGYATIYDTAYTLVLDQGHVLAPSGGKIDVADSVLSVPDILTVPAPTRVTLRTSSDIRSALSLLDEPPFRFLTKAGRPIDFAEGRARLEAILSFPLKAKLGPGEVDFLVTGTLDSVTSDRMVAGRPFASDRLDIRATNGGMEINGKGTLSGVPFDATWRQAFGSNGEGRSQVDATIELSQRFLDAFSIGLPRGSVSGTGAAQVKLRLAKGAPTRFELVSNLAGLRMRIPWIGWSKPAGTSGSLSVAGNLGSPPVIDSLKIAAAGLQAEGAIVLAPGGGLEIARFDRASLDRVFEGALDLRGQGRGKPPRIVVRSGVGDLRRASFGSEGEAGAGAGAGGLPIDIALDSLRVSSGIALTGFNGSFSTVGGLNGQFRANVNGGALVTGTAAPFPNGTGFRIRSDDAGGVFVAAGIFAKGRGGTLAMTLRPTDVERTYQGAVRITEIRVTDAPVLAELLGVISVVGLLEQLNGEGILFSDAQGNFLLTSDAVEIRDASAVGASLGVSASGVYRTATSQMSITGTISPVYLLNGIGQIFTRRREGLFGFNYQLSGTPQSLRVSVNPLSILTPGMFRDLFRAPPPTVAP